MITKDELKAKKNHVMSTVVDMIVKQILTDPSRPSGAVSPGSDAVVLSGTDFDSVVRNVQNGTNQSIDITRDGFNYKWEMATSHIIF